MRAKCQTRESVSNKTRDVRSPADLSILFQERTWRKRSPSRSNLTRSASECTVKFMVSRVVQYLALASSVFLVLPEGWCCALLGNQAQTTNSQAKSNTSDVPETTGECCPCCHRSNELAPKQIPSPVVPPSGPAKSLCACSDREATLPNTTSVEQVDASFILFLLPLDAMANGTGLRVALVARDRSPPHPALHVLHCLWLC